MADMVPTIGRVILYRPTQHDHEGGMQIFGDDPVMDAHIVFVWNPDLVNLVVFDHNGHQHRRTSVPLLQEGDPKKGGYCEWMPYQKKVAAGEIAPTLHATKEPT